MQVTLFCLLQPVVKIVKNRRKNKLLHIILVNEHNKKLKLIVNATML